MLNIALFDPGMTFLLQKELVDRIHAQPGSKSYGSLSVYVQTLCEAIGGPTISANSFHPVPDVGSKLIKLMPRKKPLIPKSQQAEFFNFVRQLFQYRRKSIKRSLGHIFENDRISQIDTIEPLYLKSRVEALSISDIFKLFQSISNK